MLRLVIGHDNEIWDKMGHNLTCMGNIIEMFAVLAVLGVGLFNDVKQILPRPTPVAMATKI